MNQFELIVLSVLLNFGFSTEAFGWRPYTTQEIRKHFEKNPVCEMAIAMSIPGLGFGDLKGDPLIHPGNILCIADLTLARGTIKEQSGCALALINVETGTLNPTYSLRIEDPKKTKSQPFAIADGKNCREGGFESLLERYPGVAYPGGTVKKALLEGWGANSVEMIAVSFADKKYSMWWEETKKNKPKKKAEQKE